MCFFPRIRCPNDADRMANSVDPDQTAPSGAALFAHAQTCLSGNLRSLLYKLFSADNNQWNPATDAGEPWQK